MGVKWWRLNLLLAHLGLLHIIRFLRSVQDWGWRRGSLAKSPGTAPRHETSCTVPKRATIGARTALAYPSALAMNPWSEPHRLSIAPRRHSTAPAFTFFITTSGRLTSCSQISITRKPCLFRPSLTISLRLLFPSTLLRQKSLLVSGSW